MVTTPLAIICYQSATIEFNRQVTKPIQAFKIQEAVTTALDNLPAHEVIANDVV